MIVAIYILVTSLMHISLNAVAHMCILKKTTTYAYCVFLYAAVTDTIEKMFEIA